MPSTNSYSTNVIWLNERKRQSCLGKIAKEDVLFRRQFNRINWKWQKYFLTEKQTDAFVKHILELSPEVELPWLSILGRMENELPVDVSQLKGQYLTLWEA